MTEEKKSEDGKLFELNQRYTRTKKNARLAQNSKESYEVLAEIFAGNDLYEQEKIARDVKLTKMIDLI